MQVEQQTPPIQLKDLQFQNSNGKLSELAFSTKSQQIEFNSFKSNGSIDQLQKQSQSTEHDFCLENITLTNIKSKEEIQIQSKQNQSILLNLNSNIDDLFKKISSLTDQIKIELKPQSSSQFLKQKNLQLENNIPSKNKQKCENKARSTPQIQFKQIYSQFNQLKQYKPIFFQSFSTQIKPYGVNMKLFQVGKSLGYGKFGQVIECRNLKTKYLYALKKIFKSIIQQYKMQEQLLIELKILSLINHPNIVKAYSSFTDDYHIFILMEYVQGISLTKKFRCSQNQIKNIITQILNAIQYLHQNKICHRDIKPENIILTAQDTVKICDFGWAAYGQPEMSILCGTLDYVSYQMAHQLAYTNKVDLWNVGVLVYELLYGTPPFKSGSKSKTFQKVKNLDYIFPEQIQISEHCKSFIEGLLKPENQRMSMVQALSHQFLKENQIKQADQQCMTNCKNQLNQLLNIYTDQVSQKIQLQN